MKPDEKKLLYRCLKCETLIPASSACSDATWKHPDIVKALNKYTGGTPNFTPPSDNPVKDENTGKVSYDKVNKSYSISVPKPSDKIYLDVQLSDKSAGGASGCIANGFMKGDTYYWAMVLWKATASGEVEIDIDRDFGTLAYSVGDESFFFFGFTKSGKCAIIKAYIGSDIYRF